MNRDINTVSSERTTLLVGIAALIGVGVWMATTIFSRFVFDDYQMAWEFRQRGLVDQAVVMYRSYSGRVLLIWGAGPLTSLGPRAALFAGPLIGIWAWVALTVIVRRVIQRLGRPVSWTSAAMLGLACTACALAGTPHQFQSLRWLTGILVYGLPSVLTLTALAIALNPPPTGRAQLSLVGLAACLLLSSGGNETQAVAQPAICALVMVMCWRRPASRLRCAVALLSSVAGSALLLMSPGSRSRSLWQPADHSPLAVAHAAAQGAATFGAALAVHSAVAIASLFALGVVLRGSTAGLPVDHATARRILGVCTAAAIISTTSIVLIPAYTMNDPAPLRAYLPAWLAIAATCLSAGWCLRPLLQRWAIPPELRQVLAVSAILLAVSGPLSLGASQLAAIPKEAQAARVWDCIDRTMQTNPGDVVVAAPSEYEGVAFIFAKPTSWPNQVMARYYGVHSVSSSPQGTCRLS